MDKNFGHKLKAKIKVKKPDKKKKKMLKGKKKKMSLLCQYMFLLCVGFSRIACEIEQSQETLSELQHNSLQ